MPQYTPSVRTRTLITIAITVAVSASTAAAFWFASGAHTSHSNGTTSTTVLMATSTTMAEEPPPTEPDATDPVEPTTTSSSTTTTEAAPTTGPASATTAPPSTSPDEGTIAVEGPTTTNPYAVKKPVVAVSPATVRRLGRVTVSLAYFPARSRVTVGIYDARNRLWMYRYITVDAKGSGSGPINAPSSRGTYTVKATVARPAAAASTKLVVT
jgi:hypothetical protein